MLKGNACKQNERYAHLRVPNLCDGSGVNEVHRPPDAMPLALPCGGGVMDGRAFLPAPPGMPSSRFPSSCFCIWGRPSVPRINSCSAGSSTPPLALLPNITRQHLMRQQATMPEVAAIWACVHSSRTDVSAAEGCRPNSTK